MAATTIKIEELVAWGEAKRIETRMGPRMLRKAATTEEFWAAWRSDKATLKEAGVSCSRDRRTGDWEACWWQPLTEDEQKEVEAAQEASRAVDSEIDLPCPKGLAYLPYQRAGIAYAMARENVLFADEMGLGKTIEAIGVYNADPTVQRVLIVCPASLRLNWRREFEKWATRPVAVAVVNGGKASDRPKTDWTVLVINYDVLSKHRQWLDGFEFDMLIADEAHYVKNSKAQRTKALLGSKTKKESRPGVVARRKLFLTGTPIVNRPIELWSLVQALDADGLGRNFMAFAKKYADAHHNGWGWDFGGAKNLDQLQRLLRERCMVRRLKKDVLTELPPKRRQVLEIPANGASGAVAREQEAVRVHEETLADLQAYVELAKAGTQGEYDEACERLQVEVKVAFTEMSLARHDVSLAKADRVIEHLEESIDSGPVVCFAHHKDVISKIAEAFDGRCVTLTGDTSMEDRQRAVDRFQAGEVDLFIGNLQAAGVGITLTRSSHVVFAELDWVPGNISQAEDRCHRIGQHDPVLVQHIVLENSLDATMAAKIVKKQAVIDAALDTVHAAPEWETPTKERPATVNITRDQIDEQAEKITPEQIVASHQCMSILSSRCDGAEALDGAGFNKMDSRIGKSLASQPTLTPRQAVLAVKLATKYHRQLPSDLLATAKGA